MTDIVSPTRRSQLMANIGSKDTKPELAVRKVAHALGFRFRLHRPDLPGRPDLVFPRLRKVLFVHGCFWHQHSGCPRAALPKTNTAFWRIKLANNVVRDQSTSKGLHSTGWTVGTIWECETHALPDLRAKLTAFLISPPLSVSQPQTD